MSPSPRHPASAVLQAPDGRRQWNSGSRQDVKAYAYFRHEWLSRHGLVADRCSIISVMGESMEPRLPEDCMILLDRNRKRRLKGHIFVVRKSDGLMVKRAGKDDSGNWLLVSDHPAWESEPWGEAEVIGEVEWMAPGNCDKNFHSRTFSRITVTGWSGSENSSDQILLSHT